MNTYQKILAFCASISVVVLPFGALFVHNYFSSFSKNEDEDEIKTIISPEKVNPIVKKPKRLKKLIEEEKKKLTLTINSAISLKNTNSEKIKNIQKKVNELETQKNNTQQSITFRKKRLEEETKKLKNEIEDAQAWSSYVYCSWHIPCLGLAPTKVNQSIHVIEQTLRDDENKLDHINWENNLLKNENNLLNEENKKLDDEINKFNETLKEIDEELADSVD